MSKKKHQLVEVKRKKQSLDLKLEKPSLPVKWDYGKSVQKVKQFIYKWKNLTEETANELWIAKEILVQYGGDRKSAKYQLDKSRVDNTWTQYCNDIGSQIDVVNRWLKQWFDESLVGLMTGNAENYTPKETIKKVKKVLGEIDLDPASCEYAQEIVKAKTYYTKEDSGLDKTWEGRIFLNPPYGIPDIRNFTDKLIEELSNIEAAILLTNDQTDTNWWQKCAVNSQIICMPNSRLSFYTPDKKETSPTNGQTFFYYGDREKKFCKVFSEEGLIVRVIK